MPISPFSRKISSLEKALSISNNPYHAIGLFYTLWKHQKTLMFLVDVSDLMSELLNPVHTTGLFLYPLKTENLWFSGVSRGHRKRPVAWNGLTIRLCFEIISSIQLLPRLEVYHLLLIRKVQLSVQSPKVRRMTYLVLKSFS